MHENMRPATASLAPNHSGTAQSLVMAGVLSRPSWVGKVEPGRAWVGIAGTWPTWHSDFTALLMSDGRADQDRRISANGSRVQARSRSSALTGSLSDVQPKDGRPRMRPPTPLVG